MPLTSEVRPAHLNRLQGHRRQPIARSGKFVRRAYSLRALDCAYAFSPSCAMYKDNAVGNVVAETGRDLVFMITARLSDLSMPLKGEVRRSPEQSARQPIVRSGKFVQRAYSRRALDCEKDDGLTCMYAFSHRDHGAHFCLRSRGGWGKRGDLTWHPAVKHQRPAAKTTNSNCCDRAAAQVKQHIPEQPGWKNSKCWANIEKRNQINTKNYWK